MLKSRPFFWYEEDISYINGATTPGNSVISSRTGMISQIYEYRRLPCDWLASGVARTYIGPRACPPKLAVMGSRLVFLVCIGKVWMRSHFSRFKLILEKRLEFFGGDLALSKAWSVGRPSVSLVAKIRFLCVDAVWIWVLDYRRISWGHGGSRSHWSPYCDQQLDVRSFWPFVMRATTITMTFPKVCNLSRY